MSRKEQFPLISVIVCCYNGAAVLGEALEAIKKQKWAGTMELIVVDDHSSDNTSTVAKSFKAKVIRNKKNLGLAASRNVGIAAAKGEIIAFGDDDCRPQPTWLRELYAVYKRNPEVMSVGGPVEPHSSSNMLFRYLAHNNPLQQLELSVSKSRTPVYRLAQYLKGVLGIGAKPSKRNRPVYSLPGANFSFRAEALAAINGFDGSFRFSGEDQDVCRRINERFPGGLWFAPKAKVLHAFVPHLQDTLRRSRAYGKGSVYFARKYSDIKPVIFPFPLLIALLAVSLGICVAWWSFPLAIFAVSSLYPRWLLVAVQKRSFEPLLYAYINFLQEVYGNYGLVIAWREIHPNLQPKALVGRGTYLLTNTGNRLAVLWSLFGATLLASQFTLPAFWRIPLMVSCILIPGYMAAWALGIESVKRLARTERITLWATLGSGVAMLVGFALYLAHLAGAKVSLDASWLRLAYAAAMVVLSLIASRKHLARHTSRPSTTPAIILSCCALALPFLSIYGALILNNGHSNIASILTFVAGAAILAGTLKYNRRLSNGTITGILYAVGLAAMWSYAMRSNYLFGWDIQQEFSVYSLTHAVQSWTIGSLHSPYNALLSITVLPTILANMTHLSGITIFKVFYPLLFSAIPILMYFTYVRFVPRIYALLGSALFIVQFAFMQEFPAVARQQTAFVFFAMLMYALFGRRVSLASAKRLAIIAVLGITVSHYSTAYVTCALLVGTYIGTNLLHALYGKWRNKTFVKPRHVISPFIIVLSIVGTVLWYGVITQSSQGLSAIIHKHSVQAVSQEIRQMAPHKSTPPAKSTGSYLSVIGMHYKQHNPGFSYYSGATNAGLHELKPVTRPVKSQALLSVVNIVEAAGRFTWWILGFVGIVYLVWRFMWRHMWAQPDAARTELAILGIVGMLGFAIIHVDGSLQSFYTPSRLNQQLLIFMGLPTVIALQVVLSKLRLQYRRLALLAVGASLCFAFLYAGGVVPQLVGGSTPSNLNNFGVDYGRAYINDGEALGAIWLQQQFKSGDIIYTDLYGTLRLQPTGLDHGVFDDVTPESLAKNAYVYMDSDNIQGINYAYYNGKTLLLSYPKTFIDTNKNLLYTNGQSEIYK